LVAGDRSMPIRAACPQLQLALTWTADRSPLTRWERAREKWESNGSDGTGGGRRWSSSSSSGWLVVNWWSNSSLARCWLDSTSQRSSRCLSSQRS
jgi:hypothetical protein